MEICTIIAKNYLPSARVLGASLREHHPDVRFTVLVIDEQEGYVDAAAEPFDVIGPEAIGLPQFPLMAGMYEILELSTAVKPWLLRTLLERDGEGAIYLDPDMRLYAPLEEVFAAVRAHGVVLNPHAPVPMPRDGRKPSEQDILIAGAYNLGFLGLGAGDAATFVLDWWSERLEMDCIVDPEKGFFVDQRWIDLVPGMVGDVHLIRDPGFNVAYWNLPGRTVAEHDGAVTVDGSPLKLFHFSGYKPTRPHELSTHQNRIRLADDPVLARLCDEYGRELRAAGYASASEWPYSYAATASGIPLDRRLRRLLREAVEEGAVTSPPFDAEGEAAFIAYVTGPADTGAEHGITRYLREVHRSRHDLPMAYPDLDDPAVAAGFLGWIDIFGRREMGLSEPLIGLPVRWPDRERRRLDGVNVAGYLNAELGVGEVARQVVAALDVHDVPVMPIGLHAPNSRQGHAFVSVDRDAGARFGINLVCVNADGLPRFAHDVGERFFAERYSIGVWWWELATFPHKWLNSFDHLDEVWAGSSFVADSLARVSPVPVVPMRLPLTVPELPAGDPRAGLGLPEGFVFLFTFDYNSVFKRKNPLAIIEAFTRAFEPGEGVSLVVKSVNHAADPENRDRLRLAAEPHPHVHLMEEYLSAADKNRLLAACDAYVSLHRSEGFGIGLAEALLLGRPVIATAYGGNTDFVMPETGYLVPHTLVPVGHDAWPYQADAEWAEPDVERAAELMRELHADPAEARRRADRGQRLLLERHSPRAAGAQMVERLELIRGKLEGADLPEADATAPLRRPDRDLRGRILATAAASRPGGRMGRAGRAARKGLLRALKPYTAHADSVALELDAGVRRNDENLRAALAHAERMRALDHAQSLAEIRSLRERLARLEGGASAPPANGALPASGRDAAADPSAVPAPHRAPR